MGRKITAWTPDRVAQLRRLAAESKTDREIALELGVTKGAVQQVVHRLGLRLTGYTRIIDIRHSRNPFYAARRAAGLTRSEASRRTGISDQIIGQYERGAAKPSRLDFWKALAQVYGCSIGDLLGEDVLDVTRHTSKQDGEAKRREA